MSTRPRPLPPTCLPCSRPGALHGPAVSLKPGFARVACTGTPINGAVWGSTEDTTAECSICHESLNADSVAYPWTARGLFLTQVCVLGHVYHKGCVQTWLGYGNTGCPECRRPIFVELLNELRSTNAPAPASRLSPQQAQERGPGSDDSPAYWQSSAPDSLQQLAIMQEREQENAQAREEAQVPAISDPRFRQLLDDIVRDFREDMLAAPRVWTAQQQRRRVSDASSASGASRATRVAEARAANAQLSSFF